MTRAAVLVPVLDRPHRVRPIVDSLRETARRADPVFVCSPGDMEEIDAVLDAGAEPLIADWEPGRGDYARKINLAWRHTDHDWVLLGADDLVFHQGWLEAALAVHARTGACVVGTNDLGNRRVVSGRHSTHSLVHRDYGECGTADDPGLLLHEGYWHNFVDDEFVQTALHRRTYAHAAAALVEHLHPHWRKADMDATYEKGQLHFDADRALFNTRARLWRATERRRRR